MRKAIIFDIDGTAMPIGEGHWPSERLKKAIAKLKDQYHISVATGRALETAEGLIEYMGIRDDCIIAGGTEIYSPTLKKIIWSEKIPNSTYKHIETALNGCDGKVYSRHGRGNNDKAHNIAKFLDGDATILFVVALSEEVANDIESKLKHPELHIINMPSWWGAHLRDIHIHSVNASKEHAVAELLKREKINKSETIVIGDGLNDLHLFRAGGYRVAMGNAGDQLKQEADLVIGNVEDDGLAQYLETLV